MQLGVLEGSESNISWCGCLPSFAEYCSPWNRYKETAKTASISLELERIADVECLSKFNGLESCPWLTQLLSAAEYLPLGISVHSVKTLWALQVF